jgi:predicted TIM-barrel fold metal-dependent hydrolase
MGTSDRYLVISVDGHAGADLRDYKPYLASTWHDEFDAWADAYVNPWGDLVDPDANRNWDTERRLRELDGDGVVAEVLYPNTIPPFFPSGNLLAPLPSRAEYERRWAGIQAHNRWLADFCAEAPGRRAGIAQILVHDVDDAVAETRWAVEHGLTGGIMLPGVPPGHAEVSPLWSDDYEPLWRTCAELDVTMNHHAGGGIPPFAMDAASRAILLIELPIYGHRALWALIFAGVFERYPELRFVLTEQGTGWVPGGLASLDWFYGRMKKETHPEHLFGGEAVAKMSLTPSEYFARNCWIGASFLRPAECDVRHLIGIDRIMWGADYPHHEGSVPHTLEALQVTFANVPDEECRLMFGLTAADVYHFDLGLLAPLADRLGPRVDDVHRPLEAWPEGTTCGAFDDNPIVRSW